MYFHLFEDNIDFEKKIIFIKDGKSKSLKITNVKQTIQKLCLYYTDSLNTPSNFMIDWIKPILTNDMIKLEKAINNTYLQNYYDDPYIEKAFSSNTDNMIKAAEVIEKAKPYLDVFENLENIV